MSRYRTRPLKIYTLSKTHVLIHVLDDQQNEVFPYAIANLLESASEFLDFEGLAQRCWDKTKGSEKIRLLNAAIQLCAQTDGVIPSFFDKPIISALSRTFKILHEKGYLISLDDFCKGDRSEAAPPIGHVGIITKNRPSAVRRALESYIQNSTAFSRTPIFSVYDDSDNEETLNALRELKKNSAATISYVGRNQKNQLIKLLAAKGIPENLLRFAIEAHDDGIPNYGANRNLMLLYTFGELAFSCDDDTVCRIAESPNLKPGLRLGQEFDSQEGWPHPSREELLQQSPEKKVDFLSLHEKVLGHPVKEIIRTSTTVRKEPLTTEFMSASMMHNIQSNKSQVLISLNGLHGDSGMGNPADLIRIKGKTKDRLLASKKDFDALFDSREMVKAVDQVTVFPTYAMMAGFYGYDNRQGLPPFFPNFRNEDALFGQLVAATYAASCSAYLPWTFLHSPEKRPHATREYGAPTPTDFVEKELKIIDLNGKMAATEVMRSFGERLKYLGTLNDLEFNFLLTKIKTDEAIEKITSFEELLTTTKNSSPHAKSYFTKHSRHLKDPLQSLHSQLIPALIFNKYGEKDGLKKFKEMIFQFGELLTYWQQIINAIKDIKKSGHLPSLEI